MERKLPIGIQDFRKIREDDFIYIDKTPYIYKIAKSSTYYFLSRPRRFGKSLTISTLNELYSGSKELFKGLWIEDQWDWSKKHPVIWLSFKSLNFVQRGLEETLTERLQEFAKKKGIELSQKTSADRFRELISELASDQKVVVLIDEYDAPIIHYLGRDLKQAETHRDQLKEFYSVLKEMDPYLEFVFLTGVSKFSKVGIFSGLNNLQDITMSIHYSNMFGYTQQELEAQFKEEISSVARFSSLSEEELLHKIKFWYNGYRFSNRGESVYNPFSINLFFTEKEFRNFWFETGTPTFLINLLKKEGLYDFSLEPKTQLEFDSFELDDLQPYGILYQTGYLTIKYRDEYGLYHLDYPNYEVENSMLAYLLEAFGGVRRGAGQYQVIKMEKALYANDVDKVIRILQAIFKGIPYFLHEKFPERFFHAAIHLLFSYMGLRVQSEVCTSDGRADCVVETDQRIFIFEFKLDESPEKALEQIKEKRYYQAYWEKGKPVTAVGVSFSSETKNIEAWNKEDVT